jgi:uroporphyrinogen-III synthase
MLNKSIFISKSLDQLPELKDWAANTDFEIRSHSFLRFEPIPFVLEETYQAIFFSSPRSFDYFVLQNPIPAEVQIACAGISTKKYIESQGFRIGFYSEVAGDLAEAIHAFKEWVNPTFKVFFPISNLSKKTYSKSLLPQQVIERVVYHTLIMPQHIPNCAIYIFTSPSNVEGFFKTNKLPKGVKTIAWGNTTSQALSHYTNVDIVLTKSSVQELIGYLSQI